MAESGSPCLVDAMVLVDAVKYGFLEDLVVGHTITVAATALAEVKHYKGTDGVKHPIDLAPFTASGRLTVYSASAGDIAMLLTRLTRRSLGEGELESLALVLKHGWPFCTADRQAVREMKDLGLLDRWVPLEELLASLNPPRPVPDTKYSRVAAEPK